MADSPAAGVARAVLHAETVVVVVVGVHLEGKIHRVDPKLAS